MLAFVLVMPDSLAGSADFEIRPAGDILFEAIPNKNITAAFHVTNKAEVQDFIAEVSLPEGWKLITKEFPFFLERNQTDLKLVSFFVPQSAAAGKYEVIYHIRGRKYPSVSDSHSFWVEVIPFRKLSMSVLQAPEFVVAGESYLVLLQIHNESNVCDQMVLKIQSPDSLPAMPEADHFTIPPGQYRTVSVHVMTDASVLYPNSHSLYFGIHCADRTEAEARAQSSVKIIPRIQGIEDRYFRLPVQWSAAFVTQQMEGVTRSGLQGNLVGAGSLDEKGEKNVSFHLRGPDAYRRSISVFAERDEYTAGFSTRRFAVNLGDRSYRLSPLTQNGRYGRGAEFNYNLNGRWSFGAYAQKARWYMSDSRSAASFVKYSMNGRTAFQFSVLDSRDPYQNGRLVSAFATLNPAPNTNLELELSAGKHGKAFEKGVQARLAGSHSLASYDLSWIYTTPDYPGYYRDTNYLSTGLVFRPIHRVSVNIGYRNEKQNFELDTARFAAPLNRYFQTGFALQLTGGTRVAMDFSLRNSKDRLSAYLFDYRETSGRFRIDQGFKNVTFSLSAETGRTENFKDRLVSGMARYMANVHFRPNHSQAYSGFAYVDENNRYSNRKMRLVTVRVDARYQLSQKAEFRLNYQNNSSPEEYYVDRNLSELMFRYTLPNRHSVQVRGRLTLLRNSTDHKDKALVVEYTAPFGIPLSVRKNSCIVKGRVFDDETGLPVKNLIIRINGSTAVTDDDGSFVFRNLKEKTYYLTLDKSSVGLNRIATRKMPIEITTALGKEGKYVEIGMTRGASLSGRVAIRRPAGSDSAANGEYVIGGGTGDSDSLRAGKGLSNILVEMARDGEIQRRMTDLDGSFSFEELRPGAWTVKFYDHNLPQYHRFEKNGLEITLAPGVSEEINGSVVPKKRRIQFLQEGGTVTEQRAK